MADFHMPSETETVNLADDLDVDNLGELLLECHTFLSALLERRQQPLWVERDGQRLLGRLGSLVEWQTVH